MSDNDFRNALLASHNFPCEYCFKFVVPLDQKTSVINLAPQAKITERLSKNGKYVSVTLFQHVETVDDVLTIYKNASAIKDLISL